MLCLICPRSLQRPSALQLRLQCVAVADQGADRPNGQVELHELVAQHATARGEQFDSVTDFADVASELSYGSDDGFHKRCMPCDY